MLLLLRTKLERIRKTSKKWIYGTWFLIKMGWPIRYNMNSEFARLRMETFYGDPKMKWTWKRISEMVGYGYWAHRMKRDDWY